MAVITHLKLFMDGGIKQVALFKGDNQAEDWLRNSAATEVLIGNWLELPMEELIPLEQAAAKGFIGNTLLNKMLLICNLIGKNIALIYTAALQMQQSKMLIMRWKRKHALL